MKNLLFTASIARPLALCLTFAGAVAGLTGCGDFFAKTTTTTCTTDCSSTTGDYLYVANAATAGPGIAAYDIASAALGTVSGSPFALTPLPSALAVNPADTYLYVGTTEGPMYVYTIGSGGALTIGNGGAAVATIPTTSMQVDSTGKWLIVANESSPSVSVFAIGTGGVLTVTNASPVAVNSGTGVPDSLAITPNNEYVYVGLSAAGLETMTFSSTDGTLADAGHEATVDTVDAVTAVAVDPTSKFVFATETGISAVRVFTIGTNGALSPVSGSPFSVGTGPSAVMVDSSGSYVYVTNRTANSSGTYTINGFALTNSGTLSALSGSPYTTGAEPVGIVEDKSDTYVAVICQGGTTALPFLELYTLSGGPLVASTLTSEIGTSPVPVAITGTH